MQNIRLDKAQAGIRLLGEISVTSDMLMLTTLMAGSEELKSLLMKVKEENEKYGLKLSIKKTKNDSLSSNEEVRHLSTGTSRGVFP